MNRTFIFCALIFFSVFLGLYGLYQLFEPYTYGYFRWLAYTVAGLLGWFDPNVVAAGNMIHYNDSPALRVIEGCDGITVIILIIAAVLSFPKPFKERLLGLAILVPLLFAINWLRLVVLALIRFYWPQQFDLFHVYLFQPVMVFTTFVCFIAWIMYDGKPQSR